jgi:hypothetical protein
LANQAKTLDIGHVETQAIGDSGMKEHGGGAEAKTHYLDNWVDVCVNPRLYTFIPF